MRRLGALTAALATAALALAGCGGSSGSSTEDALGYMPKDAPLVFTLDTDPDGAQWQNVDHLLGKFPGAGVAKSQFKQGISRGSGGKIDYDRDLKPLLGNELVVTIPTAAGLSQASPPVLIAWKVGDEGKAREMLLRDAKKVGTAEGADLYAASNGSSFMAITDSTLVAARTQTDLDAALKRHADGSGMTAGDLDKLMAGLGGGDALVRIGVNIDAALAASPKSAVASKVKWLAALRDSGQAIKAEDDGIEYDFRATTDGSLAPTDLPLAAGAQAPQIIRRAGEIGFGLRDAAQTIHFSEQVARLTNPAGFARYGKQKQHAAKVLGIDLDRDLIDQFSGDSTLSVSLDGAVAFRSAVKDPAALKATLQKAAPRLKKLNPGRQLGISTPPGNREGLYAIAEPGGTKLVFGVVGNNFVAASDAARAGQVGGQSASTVPGAKGAFAMVLDARSVVNAALAKRGQGTAAQLLTGALGDFAGSVESETDALSGSFKLTVK
jgi:hypothetical protein